MSKEEIKKEKYSRDNRDVSLDNDDFVYMLKPNSRESLENYVNRIRELRRMQAYARSQKRNNGVNINGANCLSTGIDNYISDDQYKNKDYFTISDTNLFNNIATKGVGYNPTFKENAARYGFKEINPQDAEIGDILQFDWSDIKGGNRPRHATMLIGRNYDDTPISSYSDGTYVPNSDEHYHQHSSYWKDPNRAFTYIGTPREQTWWHSQWDKENPIKGIKIEDYKPDPNITNPKPILDIDRILYGR